MGGTFFWWEKQVNNTIKNLLNKLWKKKTFRFPPHNDVRLCAWLGEPIVTILIGIPIAFVTQSNGVQFIFGKFQQPFGGYDGQIIA